MDNFWNSDSNGNFQETKSLDEVDEFWKFQVLQIVSNLAPILANSDYGIYLRGSIARNKANKLYSDIDLVIILAFKNVEIINLIRDEICSLEILLNRKIDLDFIDKEHFFKSKKWQFIVKVHSIFINGTLNLKPSIQKFKIGSDCILYLDIINKITNIQLDKIQNNLSALEDVVLLCKILIRASFELTINRERIYTRDLDSCHHIFLNHYPNMKIYADYLLLVAKNNLTPEDVFFSVVHEFCEFLGIEYTRIYGHF